LAQRRRGAHTRGLTSRRRTSFARLALLAVLVACGGSIAGAPQDAGRTDDATASSSGGSPVDAGAGSFDAHQSSTDAVAAADVTALGDAPFQGNPPTYPSIECPAADGGPATCEPGQYCCIVGNAMQGAQTDTCEPLDASCSGTPVHCAVPSDCEDGKVCCGTEQTVGGITSYVDVSCAASCIGANQRIFCNPLGPYTCPSTAPTCALSSILPGYDVCNL
jgi:hypothetical protein